MQRKDLEELGLTKEVIDKIMKANGEDIENARATEIAKLTDLQQRLDKRDADYQELDKRFNAAKGDQAKLEELQASLASMQEKYKKERDEWATKQKQQAYRFAAERKADTLKFSSKAARSDFLSQLTAADLKQDGEEFFGYQDFLAKYKEADPTAFAADEPQTTKPSIVAPTAGPAANPSGAFNFNFSGVRPKPNN